VYFNRTFILLPDWILKYQNSCDHGGSFYEIVEVNITSANLTFFIRSGISDISSFTRKLTCFTDAQIALRQINEVESKTGFMKHNQIEITGGWSARGTKSSMPFCVVAKRKRTKFSVIRDGVARR
jgi:hypothetical protein